MHAISLPRRALAAGSITLSLALTPLAVAQNAATNAPRGAEAVTGGISKDEADQLRREAASYPLEIQFARRMDVGNAFAADVQVRILDASGRPVLEVPNAEPILLANLPPGRYTIEATYEGQMKRQTVGVGRGRTQLTMVW